MAKLDKAIAEEKPTIEFSVESASVAESPQAKLLRIMEEEKKLVKGRFKNYETPGASATIILKKYHEKYMPMFTKKMADGEVYEIPLYVARHLNGIDVTAEGVDGKTNSCGYLVHGFLTNPDGTFKQADRDGSGNPVPIFTNKYQRRYGFESLEFGN